MAASPLFASAVHLTDTGHVLAVVSCGKLVPTLQQLTGDDHVRLRFPGTHDYLNVPSEVLSVTRVEVTADVLDRPQWYVRGSGTVPLTLGDQPDINAVAPAPALPAGAAGKKFVVVWQSAETSFPEAGVLDASGNVPSATSPPGAIARLVALEGGKLHLTTLT